MNNAKLKVDDRIIKKIIPNRILISFTMNYYMWITGLGVIWFFHRLYVYYKESLFFIMRKSYIKVDVHVFLHITGSI